MNSLPMLWWLGPLGNQSGSLTVVPITTGSTTTNITIPNNTDADGAGTAIASALDAVSGVSSSYDSGTNKVTVITSGDVSVGTISNANSLSVSRPAHDRDPDGPTSRDKNR